MPRASKLIFIPALAGVAVIYSALFPVNRFSAEAGLPYIGYVFWFSLLATAALTIPAAVLGHLPRLTWPHIRAYFVLGALGIAFPVPLLAFVAPKLPLAIITLLLILVPMITYVLSYLVRIERFRVSGAIGVLLGLAGILLVLVPDLSLPEPEMAGWLLLALVAPLCFGATNTMAVYLRPPAAPPLAMSVGMTACATILLVPIMLGTGQAYLFPGPTLDGMLAVLYAAAINASTMVCWFILVRRIGAVFFSQFNYFIVLAGFGWGYWLYDEQHSVYVWAATGLTFLGLAIFSRGAQIASAAEARGAG